MKTTKLIALTPKEFAESLALLISRIKPDRGCQYHASTWLGKVGEVRVYVKDTKYSDCGYIVIKNTGEIKVRVRDHIVIAVNFQIEGLKSIYTIANNTPNVSNEQMQQSMCFNCQVRPAVESGLCRSCTY